MVIGRDRAKLGAFWKPSFRVARCGNHTGAVVNPDSGRPVIVDDSRLLRQDLDKPKRYAEELATVALCGDGTKPRKRITAPSGRLMANASVVTHRSSLSANT